MCSTYRAWIDREKAFNEAFNGTPPLEMRDTRTRTRVSFIDVINYAGNYENGSRHKTGEFAFITRRVSILLIYNMPHHPGNFSHVELFISERVVAAQIVTVSATHERDT